MSSARHRILRITITVIAIVQAILGVVFIAVPAQFAQAQGLADAPAWTRWIFAMFGARALGYAYGLLRARRDPAAHRTWLTTMIAVQAIDWLATIGYVTAGAVTFAQVSTASFLPLLFIAGLMIGLPRRAQQPNPSGVSVGTSTGRPVDPTAAPGHQA